MTERKVYRSRRVRGGFVLLCGIPFLAVGLCGLIAGGRETWFFFGLFVVGGVLALALGYQVLTGKVIVDDNGISKCFRLGRVSSNISWIAIESWLVSPCDVTADQEQAIWAQLYPGATPEIRPIFLNVDDSFTFRAALFRVRGQRWPVVVYDVEAWRPDFNLFLEDVRAHIGDREVVLPNGTIQR